MLKFIRGKGQQPSAERQKLQRELFAFRKTIQHGFPNKPTALAWEPLLRLAAVGTAGGTVKVYGRPGVEFYGQHTNSDSAVTQLHFIPGAGRVVSLCDDNSLHLWEINDCSLVEVKSIALEGKLKRISAICVEASGEHLLLGTEGGNVYLLNLKTFTTAENIIYQDVVVQNCPEDYKLNPGAVEVVSEHPTDPNLILIGYNRGLMVIWDRKGSRAKHTLISNQQLESICWHEDGNEFTSSHNDGSYVTWHVGGTGIMDRPSPEPKSLYGPYACKAITKILIRKSVKGEALTVFAGGMPRSSYSDKYTVTVQQGDKHVAFDFTSRVIDFFTTTPIPEEPVSKDTVDESADSRYTKPLEIGFQSVQQVATTLIVLAEEELVAIDLQGDTWKMMPLPYLLSLHACAVTCTQLINNVSDEIYNNILSAGQEQTKDLYSSAAWPVTGGSLLCAKPGPDAETGHQILLTGHEDGSVRFWDAGGVTLKPLYKFTTVNLFSGEDITEELEHNNESEEEWPPFKRVGIWDPYSDDPRLAVKKVTLCGLAGVLLVAGTAGHVVLADMGSQPVNREIKVVLMNIVSDRDGFVWKGHDQLNVKHGPIKFGVGFQPTSVLQIHPPAAVTCAVIHSEWGVAAAGTAHGLTLYDYRRCKPVAHRCTLNANDVNGAGDTPISRRKSFKKSLRESFRRLRKGRSQRRARPAQAETNTPAAPVVQTPPKKIPPQAPDTPDTLEAKPVERQIEARPVDDSMGSIVKCLYFARTFLISAQSSIPTLWAGTNNGTVYAFTISVPVGTRRDEDDVHCQLAKEIQLKHRAPVIGITVLDGASVPLPDPLEVERGVSPLPDASQPHRVLIASEEQFKIFSLPSLKPYCKYKLTAHEGARVRRMAFGSFSCYIDSVKHTEVCLLCLTNLGDCLVLSIPELRRQLNAAAVRKEDITGISTLTFSKSGEALYLHSSSELQRITVSATKVTNARCHLTLPAWAREGEVTEDVNALEANVDSAGQPLVNGDHKDGSVDEAATGNHDVTSSSAGLGDITVDSVKEHLVQSLARHAAGSPVADDMAAKLANINLQTSSVNQSSVIVKTTTLTTLNNSDSGPGTTEATTTTTTHHANATNTENSLLEHTREEGQITRVETSTVTVPAGTDPKTILEMFERTRTPLSAPLARSEGNEAPVAAEAR